MLTSMCCKPKAYRSQILPEVPTQLSFKLGFSGLNLEGLPLRPLSFINSLSRFIFIKIPKPIIWLGPSQLHFVKEEAYMENPSTMA